MFLKEPSSITAEIISWRASFTVFYSIFDINLTLKCYLADIITIPKLPEDARFCECGYVSRAGITDGESVGMLNKAKSMNITSSWKASLFVGLVLGLVLASAFWNREQGPSQEDHELLTQENAQLTEENKSLQSRYDELEAQKTLELEQQAAQLEQKTAELEQQRASYEAQIAKLKRQQKQLSVTTKKLDTKVVELKTTTEKQKVVLTHSKELYQQQLELQKQIVNAEGEVKKAKSVAKEFKQACDEFKSGKSWNWVSQADCDKYEAKLDLVESNEAELSALNKELDTLNRKIEIDLPK